MAKFHHPLFGGLALLTGPLAWRAERRYQALESVTIEPYDKPFPSLSIIIPARNEAENLKCLLPSLQCQNYNGSHEIIVVDDQSTDGTSAVARQYNTTVIQGNGLPDGWLGKPYACHQGALAAKSDWFLFTDADTIHKPGGLSRAMTHVMVNKLDGLSIFPHQETQQSSDSIALMVAFAGMVLGLPKENSFLNGQYILVHRDVYFESGGFSAVSGEPLEDLALGHHLKTLNYHVPILRGEDCASVRMYKDTRGLFQGLVRIGGGSLGWMGLRSLLPILFISTAVMPLIVFGFVVAGWLRGWWLVAGWISSILGFISWGRRFGSAWWALMAPFGALFVQFASTWGLISKVIGRGFRWKGRTV